MSNDISGDECNKPAGSENAMLPVPDAMLGEEEDSSQETKWSRTKYLHFERRVLILGQHGFEAMTSEQPFSEVVQQSEVISHIYAKIKAPYNLLLKIFGEEEIISLGEDLRAYEKLASYTLSDALTTLKPREEKALKLRYGIDDNLLDGFCCFCQIACAGIRTGNIINIVIAVKRLSRFDNGWSRHILRIFGSSCIVVVRKWHQALQPQGLRGFGCLPGNEIGKFEHTRYTISSMFWMFRKP